ncbi:MAG TPA: DUF389 domain-containing protein [Solirubrobacteraceae bacterium]|nr:DUF389 domain-containing protein [Solirubrobacteraceae bacterium]
MLRLRVFGPRPAMADVAQCLQEIPGARHVTRLGDGDGGGTLVTADLGDDAVDRALQEIKRLGVPVGDVILVREDTIGQQASPRPLATVVWADLLSQAGVNARPFARFLLFMAIAGVIAGFGVIYANVTLVVGAMAISPDALPVTAAATALVLRRWRLAARAVVALVCGLAITCLVAGLMTRLLNALALLPSGFVVGKGGFLEGLSSINISTPIVALVAGVASILALETRASSAVGVAISVTTIPAAAYLGVAAGVSEVTKAEGALLVLGVNIVMLLTGGCFTLLAQRWLAARRSITRKG